MKELTLAMNDLRNVTPKSMETRKAKGSEIWPYYKNGQPKERVIIFLRSSGCEWVKRSGGCTMCQHAWEGTTQGIPISADDYIAQFVEEAQKYTFTENLSGVCVFNEGNFFNESELPIEARRYIISYLTKIPKTKSIVDITFETLPEYLNQAGLYDIAEIVKSGRNVTVGIGLESSDYFVRKIINKPFSLKTYEKAVKSLHEIGARVLAYILVKPPFLTENEALEDTIKTINYAFNVGTDVVSLEPINIGAYTIAGKLHNKNLYRAPWLWTTFKAVLETYENNSSKEIRIGGVQYKPSYKLVPHNCPNCNELAQEAINDWNKNQQIENLCVFLNEFPCNCKKEWKNQLKFIDQTPLLDRPKIYLV